MIGAAGVALAYQQYFDIINANLCPDERDFQLGLLCGGIIGGMAAGPIGRGFGPKISPRLNPTKCFVAGTLVVMADGSLKPIERIEKDDMVLAKDQKSGELVARKVTDKQTKYAQETLLLSFSDGQRIETTDEHPFFVEGSGWTPASELGIGTSIVTRAGPSVKVSGIERKITGQVVYNFSVEEHQNYFVVASTSNQPLWVHNYDDPQEWLYRDDTRSPDEIFQDGFTSRGDDLDIIAHVYGNKNSGYIPTTRSYNVVVEGSSADSNIYIVRAKGVDISKTIGSDPFNEMEVAVPIYIPPSSVRAVTDGNVTRLNPNWIP